jgi:hypothetical protein
MIHRLSWPAALWLCLCFNPSASAQPAPAAMATTADLPAGLVKRSLGQVSIEHRGQTLPARPGMAVQVGDTLRTGPDGAVGITLADDTLLTTGPGSELVISTFAFDATSHDGQLLASLWRGTLHVVTGLIGKRSPDKVNVQTRTVVLGSRGTEFIVDTRGADR